MHLVECRDNIFNLLNNYSSLFVRVLGSVVSVTRACINYYATDPTEDVCVTYNTWGGVSAQVNYATENVRVRIVW